MPLPWFKSPREITCPICGAQVPVQWARNNQFQPKPYCNSCAWNVARARTDLQWQVGQIVLLSALMALYVWAMTGLKWSIPLFAGAILIYMGSPILTRLLR